MTPAHTWSLSQKCVIGPLSETLSENFVEIGHFQRNFDKVVRQSA
jgi:hypothetical protein